MNLIEIVMAIAISGLVLTGTVMTTTETLIAYQAMDAGMEARMQHEVASVRAGQIVDATWRDANPPTAHGTLDTTTASAIDVGDWELRDSSGALEQRYQGGTYAALATGASGFAISYLLDDGTTVSTTLSSAQRDQVLAVRFAWTESGTSQPFGGWCVTPDRQFAQGNLVLPPPDTSGSYSRSDYEATWTTSLGSWP